MKVDLSAHLPFPCAGVLTHEEAENNVGMDDLPDPGLLAQVATSGVVGLPVQ